MFRPKRYLLRLGDVEIQFGDRTMIVGVLNVTPDSFSDGGQFLDPDGAFAHAMEMEQQGADFIDVGAESTRPGSARVPEAEEIRRLVPVLKRLRGKLSIPVMVDTYKASVAEKAIEYGAVLINDPSNLTFDVNLAQTVAKHDCGFVLNHMRGTPDAWAKLGPMADPMGTVLKDLEASIHRAVQAGVRRQRIVIDPGLGFGKRGDQNHEILARLGRLKELDVPVMVGPSRKQFLAQKETNAADWATAAAVTGAILQGAHMVRVHNVAAMRPVVQTADALLRAAPPD